MHIIEFFEKHRPGVRRNSNSFDQDWASFKDTIKNDPSYINLAIEQFMEKQYDFGFIKQLFELNPEQELIKNNPNLFKWAASFHSGNLIRFFHQNLNVIDDDGAINAAIKHHRLDNLKVLIELGINVFNEKHFASAVKSSYSSRSSNIVEYYIQNLDKFKITEYSKKVLEDFSDLIEYALNDQNFETVDYIIKNGAKHTLGYLFTYSCDRGNRPAVTHLLESYQFNDSSKIKRIEDKQIIGGYNRVCNDGNLELADYLMTHSKLDTIITPKTTNSIILRTACLTGELSFVDYLLTSPKLKAHADISANNHEVVTNACSVGNLEIVQYLLTSDKLNVHASFSANNDKNFIAAIESENRELVEYLILNNYAENTKEISTYLDDNKLYDIANMFKVRDLNNKLEEGLPKKEDKPSKKPKV